MNTAFYLWYHISFEITRLTSDGLKKLNKTKDIKSNFQFAFYFSLAVCMKMKRKNQSINLFNVLKQFVSRCKKSEFEHGEINIIFHLQNHP